MNKASYAIVVSQYNVDITEKLLEGAVSHLIGSGVGKDCISIFKVPGAVEIPLIAKLLARRQKYKAIIALGAVIRGDTDHYDYVCEQVSQGCQKIMLEFEIPVIFGVLTTLNKEQALERVGGVHGHKGIEAADAALQMVVLMSEVKNALDHKSLI
ncbi:MAG: 6,7-dimethyl-8-ribityllumazine synthase [Gammaproteobacteria bacterium RIFCSPLOWO2_02_FULL_38_11]|nr:MAG: 6,7-dimethyl-8-ribityllumazine synthase [Gammaproteobacteria bacterium RIFCSPHIGHO2_12_38_15]OGT68285.1 MAG: 6,7-dimethyl-8-ribityllumazine synthase [Gammaproteobacteria bacterium RIFCSPLOWO2_02_FULL_38_11]OGT76287.1 MAG: 6,7-dimethyl-8-ribityllumazine synthase [Gammaproteobacteria bacterium RIFCSPLOWO2_12_FULL_38_14]